MKRVSTPAAPAWGKANAPAELRDGAAAGAAELRAVVERMDEFLGAAHQDTVKWQRVLEGLSADSYCSGTARACQGGRRLTVESLSFYRVPPIIKVSSEV